VNEYQTLASVAGAPQFAFASASSASVVASVESTVSLKGSAEIVTAPAKVSFAGGAAASGAVERALLRSGEGPPPMPQTDPPALPLTVSVVFPRLVRRSSNGC
jgi:hypothetical protein